MPDREVHIWRAALKSTQQQVLALSKLLCAEELARAARFLRADDRDRFVISHGALRSILGLYMRTDPATLRFERGAYGKPALAEDPHHAAVRFNIAHSGDLALFAVSQCEVGVDLELIRSVRESRQIADRYYSPGEIAAMRSASEGEWNEAFLKQWTRKEAFLKVQGCGLSLEPDRFEILPGMDGRSVLVISSRLIERWSLVDLTPLDGYVGALAVDGQASRLMFWQWSQSPL